MLPGFGKVHREGFGTLVFSNGSAILTNLDIFHINFEFDSLEIYEGSALQSKIIYPSESLAMDGTYISTSNYVYIEFHAGSFHGV